MTIDSTVFELEGADHKRIRGNRIVGKDRQILFITGFLSKRWGNKSKALAQWCQERGWGFCCFDFRGWGDSEGQWGDYRLLQWLEDAEAVMRLLVDGPPVTIVGNSLGGWLAWLVAQKQPAVEELILIAPAFNMMDLRAAQISEERRERWQSMGAMPWDDEPLHREAPIPWHWVEDSQTLWRRRFTMPRRVKTTILHGLQDTVINPEGSWAFVQHVLSQDPEFPIELLLKTGDHRLSSPEHLETFRRLVVKE
ncbi:MAG: AB hydrolase-1 domain-containing protein [Nitrospira sp.]|nr:alpha/beta fold hydrolase [Nitrospira sp.]ULA60756.1 MAG: AB hydrolase-1 domain-containing protein [Nitrospira sp.]